MTTSTLTREFGSHHVTPEEIFPELEWESFGPLGKKLVEIFKDLTIPETWVAVHDNGNLTACHNPIRGVWKDDLTCKVVLVAGIHDTLMSIGGFCWLGLFTEEEWAEVVTSTKADTETARQKAREEERRERDRVKQGPEESEAATEDRTTVEERIPKRDPVVGAQLRSGLSRDRHDKGFRMQWGNSRFREVLTQIRDRLEAAGYSS